MVQAPDLLHALLELGVCSPGDVDEAQARQLIYGGELELNLLELQAVGERDLLRALAHATRGSAAALGPLPVEREASTRVRAIASDAVAGFSDDGAFLVSLAGPPTDQDQKALLDAAGARKLVVQYATKLRLIEACARLDDATLDRRTAAQLQTSGLLIELQPAPPPLSLPAEAASAPAAAFSLPVESVPAPLPAVPPPVAGTPPADSSLSELSRFVSKDGPKLAGPQHHVTVTSAVTPAPEHKASDETAPPPAGYQELARSVIPPPLSPDRPVSERPRAPVVEPAYSQKQALLDLATAKDRDAIVSTICRFCAQFFEYVAIFGIQASEARGLVASGPGKPSERVHDLRIPLDVPSALSRVKETGQHRVARLRAGGLEGGLVRDLQRPLGRAVLLLPILVQERTLLLIWADDGIDDVDIEHALPALALVRPAGAALERVLIERKRASRLARPSLVPGATSKVDVQQKPELEAPPPAVSKAIPEAPAPAAPAPVLPVPALPAPEAAKPPGARTFDSRPTRLGMSIPPAGTRRMSSAPPGPAKAPPALEARHETKRDLAPPEARASSPARPLPDQNSAAPAPAAEARPTPEAPKKRKLRESFPDVEPGHRPESGPSAPSDPPLAFPSDFPRTMKGFPADLKLKSSLSPAPKVGTPLLSRRIVAVSEQPKDQSKDQPKEPAKDQPKDLPLESLAVPTPGVTPGSAETMLSRKADIDSPPPRISERPPARPSPAPLSYRALVSQWLSGEEEALVRLIEGGESAVGALIAAFPGPVQEPASPKMRASECGPVLKAIAAIGNKATPFLTVRTADEDAFVRRWAVFLLGELPGRDAARAIADRLLDETVDVRRAALASARRVQTDALTRRTLRARLEEMTRDSQLMTDERCAAVEAIADIREHESIPTLLQLLDDESGAVKRAARWALSVLTRHDFQEDVQKWRDFWQRNRNESRSEWLLLALRNTQGDLARAAADEIESLTGTPIGDIEHLTEENIAHLRETLRRPSS